MADRAQLFRTEALQQRQKNQHGSVLECHKQYSTLPIYCSLLLPIVMLMLATVWYANSSSSPGLAPALILDAML